LTTTVSGLALSEGPDNGLLEDKLRIPRPDLPMLQRGRLVELLDAAVGSRVIQLTGPPGAGKTVATAHWAAARPAATRPAWVTLDEDDRDPAVFWRYVVAALGRAGALGSSRSRPLPDVEAAELPQWLTAAVKTAGAPVVLVLDDVHLLAGSEALAGLNELIRHEPPGLRLLLAGRFAPGLALAKLRLGGELADIGAAELACTAEETAAYFNLVGMPLDAGAGAEVLRRTEGWLAGLRLTALAGEAGPAGPAALIADYIEDEVLAGLTPRLRQFLLRTSLTDAVPAELASQLTGDNSAAQQLDQLSRRIGLIQAVDPAAAQYRYHPMLRDALAGILRREIPDEVPVLQRRIARWHAARGEILTAVQAAADVADWDFVRSELAEAGPAVVLSGESAALAAALLAMPADLLAADPALPVALAAARLWQGDADGALPHLEHADSLLDEAGNSPLQLWAAALRVLHKGTVASPEPGWLDGEWSLASAAHEDPRGVPEHRALGVLWLALGFAALGELDSQRARSALLHAGSQLSAGGVLSLRERARAWEAVACAYYGDLAAAIRLSAAVTDGPHGQDSDLTPVLALAAAAAALTRDEPEAAAAQLDEADLAAISARPAGEPSIGVLSGLMRARLAVADGNLAGARGLVRWLTEAAAGAVVNLGPPGADMPPQAGAAAGISVLDAEISLASGERDRARATLDGLHDQGGPAWPAAAVCRARLLIAQEDDKAALGLLEPLLADPAGVCTVTDRVAALLTAVVAHRRLGQPTDAAELLAQALALAEPDDASGPFVAAGTQVRSALTVLISPSSRFSGFAGRILERFDGHLPRPAPQQAAGLLTDSELAVLRFLPSHMTNQEIAEALFLSINTIKTHLSSVYRKLGVVNRRQAIAQGRRLELLLRGRGQPHGPWRPAPDGQDGRSRERWPSSQPDHGGHRVVAACRWLRPASCSRTEPPRCAGGLACYLRLVASRSLPAVIVGRADDELLLAALRSPNASPARTTPYRISHAPTMLSSSTSVRPGQTTMMMPANRLNAPSTPRTPRPDTLPDAATPMSAMPCRMKYRPVTNATRNRLSA
jgi:LuxR family maltose regulon positive regulatory protein